MIKWSITHWWTFIGTDKLLDTLSNRWQTSVKDIRENPKELEGLLGTNFKYNSWAFILVLDKIPKLNLKIAFLVRKLEVIAKVSSIKANKIAICRKTNNKWNSLTKEVLEHLTKCLELVFLQ